MMVAVALLATPSAHAARVRVVAATELRIDPRIDPSGEVTLAVRARDDHGQPVRGHLTVTVTAPHRPADVYQRETSATDEATRIVIARDPSVREFHVSAELVGSTSVANAHLETDVDLATPYVTVDLQVPPLVDMASDEIVAGVTVHVGEIVPANPAGWPVALYVTGQSEPRVGEADDTGFHAFHIPIASLHGPGVVTMFAAYARHGTNEVRSSDHRVVVRAATRTSLARVQGNERRLVGTVDTAAGPVRNAAVRVLWNNRVVAAALTDERGFYGVDIDPEIVTAPNVALRAEFEPNEPWYLPSHSRALTLTSPEPRKISWRWALVPLAVGVVVLVVMRFRRSAAADAGRESIPAKPIGDAVVERVGDGRGARVTLMLRPEDRATHAAIEGATVSWTTPPLGERPASEPVVTTTDTRFDCEVRAPGYASRSFGGELDRAGEYHVKVPLRSWREELFERARTWMRRAGAMGSPALPTPREVLSQRGEDPDAERLVATIEEGTYGPRAPDAATVATADTLVDELESGRQRER